MRISVRQKHFPDMMKILTQKRCVIGEAPIWNEREGLLYFVNAEVSRELIYYSSYNFHVGKFFCAD